jgi:transposase InsO family protein
VTDLLSVAGISRQAYYQALKVNEQAIQDTTQYLLLIIGMRNIHPGMGLREIYRITQPKGIGRDAFMLLGLRNGYQLQCRPNPVRTTFSTKSHRYSNLLQGKRFTDINQIWSSDITYFQAHGVTYYIVFILDVYSRRIVGWNVETHMRTENLMGALEKALTLRGILDYHQSLIHHSDKGTQYASNLYTEALEKRNILISMCNEVYENTHIERVNGTIKHQYLDFWLLLISDLKSLKKLLDKAVLTYNTLRPHASLEHLTPIEFEQQILNIPIQDRPVLTIYTNPFQFKNVTNNDFSQLKLDF